MNLSSDLQRATLHLHGELIARAPSYAGQLILTAGSGTASSGLLAAASLAGAASLTIDPDAQSVKAAIRHGAADFVVNTLDEALRALKNEIRQRRPLAVVLTADPEPARAEALERGLLPDLAINADTFPGRDHLDLTEPTAAYEAWLQHNGWSEHEVPTNFMLPSSDPRHAILARLGRYQRLSHNESRFLWLTETEAHPL
jgi:hypothetical protein